MVRHRFYFQSVMWEAYQAYLRESQDRASLRGFAKTIGLNSGTLSLIFKGRRSLNNRNASKVADLLKLNSAEKELFVRSVALYKSKSLYKGIFANPTFADDSPVSDQPNESAEAGERDVPANSNDLGKWELEETFKLYQTLETPDCEFCYVQIPANSHLLPEAKKAIANFIIEMRRIFHQVEPEKLYSLAVQFFPANSRVE